MTDKPREDRYIPTSPTDGWMLSELARLGVHMRGQPWTTESLARLLRERGYLINTSKKKETKIEDDR